MDLIQGGKLGSGGANRALGEALGMVIALLMDERCEHVPLRPLSATMILVGWDADFGRFLRRTDPPGLPDCGLHNADRVVANGVIGAQNLPKKGIDDGDGPLRPGCLGQ